MSKTKAKSVRGRKIEKSRLPFPPDPVQGEKIEALGNIAPLWRYVSRYLFAMSFADLPQDERDRIALAVRSVDDGLISCGYKSGAFSTESAAEIEKAAGDVMKSLPKELGRE